MSVSLKSDNTAVARPARTSDLESPDVASPLQPNLEDVEKEVRRIIEAVSRSTRAGHPEIALEALVNVRSIVQQEIDSLIKKRDSGSYTKDEVQALQVATSPPEIPKVSEPTNAPEEEDVFPHASDDTSSQSHDSDDEDSDSTDECTLEEPIYDRMDDVYRCANPDCGWEVAFGRCQGCNTKYIGDVVEDDVSGVVDPTNPLTVLRRGILTRCDSPPPEAVPDHLRSSWYDDFPQEFDELVSRGATRAFCETWRARFNEDCGIVVRPSDDLRDCYEDLSEELGFPWYPHWSIWIGRRIKLEDWDLNGRRFMEDLLDIIFCDDDDGLWITYKDHQDSWVTRPKEGPEIEGMVEVLEIADEYEVLSGEEDDYESSIQSYGEGEGPEAEASSVSSGGESTWWSDDSENETEAEGGEAGEDIEVDAQGMGQAALTGSSA